MSDGGGDPACWAERVCNSCGAVVENPSPAPVLPSGLVLVRTTPSFDRESTPVGLQRTHRVATGVWGRLVVESGCLGFRFEDDGLPLHVAAGRAVVIPPDRPHRVELGAPVRFHVEFHAPAPDDADR